VNHTNKFELVVDTREVLEARPRSTPPQAPDAQDDVDTNACEDERWDNAPCTD
jgi:hypothetical protein